MTHIVSTNQNPAVQVAQTLVTEHEGSRFDFFGMLKRRKWLIFFGLVVGIGIGVLYYVKAPVVYGADAEVFVQRKAPSILQVAGSKSIVPEMRFESHEKVIASEFMVRKTVDENPMLQDLESFEGYSPSMIEKKIRRGLEVIPDRDDPNVYTVYFQGSNPGDCKYVIDSLLDTYEEHLKARQKDVGRELEAVIERASGDIEAKIEQLRQEQIDFRAANEDVVFNNDGLIVNSPIDQLSELDRVRRELGRERTDLILDLEWIQEEIANNRSRNVLIFLLEQNQQQHLQDDEPLQGFDSYEQAHVLRLFELQFALDDLLLRYGADHPDVKAQEMRIQRYLDEWNRLTGGDLNNDPEEPIDILGMYVVALQERLNNLHSLLEEYDRQFNDTLNISRRYSELQEKDNDYRKQALRLEATHEKVLDHLQEVVMQKDQEAYDFERLSYPALQAKQVAPNVFKVMAVALFLGLSLGGGLAYMVDVADKTYRSPQEITQQMQLPLIGHIPVISADSHTDYSESRIDPSVVTYHRPKSKMSEAYRAVRTSLYFSNRGDDHKVIQVTSPSPGDGKTTLSCNLAVAMANSGKRVVLVDADLRRPRVHQIFGEDTDAGFASVLAGKAEPKEAIIETEVENLWLLPCGVRPSNPAELLTSRRLSELIDLLRDNYDYVIVDSPPVLAVTDPCTIAPRVDSTILTFRIKKNVKLSAERAREILSSVGGNVGGIVVNGVGGGSPLASNRYGYGGYGNRYYNYSYSYGYGYANDFELGYVEYYDEDDDVPARIERSNSASGNGRR